MAKIKIKSVHPQATVIVKCFWKKSFQKEQCELLKNNYIKSLMRLSSVSGKKATFTAPADMKLVEMLHKGINRETFFQIITQVINILRWLNSQELSITNLELNMDYVFANSNTKELFLLYIPVKGETAKGNLRTFLENLVFESSFNVSINTDFKQELMILLNSGANINAKMLEQYVLTNCPEVGESIVKATPWEERNISDSKSEYLRQMGADKSDELHTQRKGTDIYYESSSWLNYGERTMVLEQEEGSVVLNEESGTVVLVGEAAYDEPDCPKLIRKRTGEEIHINKPVFRIGKEEGSVDYLIPNNPTISRTHADIISCDDRYYLYDNNSTNRSYVNNIIVEPLKNVEIYDGTSVRLSDEEFEFRTMSY